MQMLLMRKGRVRNDGSRAIVPLLRERDRKFGPIKDERAISTRRDVLITGAHGAGKTRWVSRYVESGPQIWPGRPVLYLRALNPLLSWGDHADFKRWLGSRPELAPRLGARDQSVNDDERGEKLLHKLRCYERMDRLVQWIEEAGAVVVVDDGHLLQGRKADIAVRALRVARLVVVSSAHEGKLPLTIRLVVQQRDPQRINLSSEASYDATSVLVWLLSIVSLGAGAWPVAAALGGMHMLARGNRAAKAS